MNGSLLDTNIVSEFAKPVPSHPVYIWLRDADPESLFASVITLGEIRLGIENLPIGRRRSILESWLRSGLPSWFESNLLPVTRNIAERWGWLTIYAKRKGITLNTNDGLLAATALEHNLVLVTRNTKDFSGLNLSLINPWEL